MKAISGSKIGTAFLLLLFLFSNMENVFSFESNKNHFEATSNSPVFVIKLSSTSPIFIKELVFEVNLSINANFSGAFQDGFFLTNRSIVKWYGNGASEISSRDRKLYYFHIKLGKFNFTYDNRCFTQWSFNGTFGGLKLKDFSLPPGEWYFVFVTVFFDLKGKYNVSRYVTINFSKSKELEISTFEGGKIYAIWYGEFDSNLAIKHKNFDLMLNGKISINVNNTLIYSITGVSHGVEIIKINKPDGSIERKIFISRHGLRYSWHGNILGIGEKGNYEFTINYWDRKSLDIFNTWFFSKWTWPSPPYFIGIDVRLP